MNRKTFSFKNFYLRRFRRIIPSVLSFTIFVQILLFFIEDNKEIYEISKCLIYSLFFTANIYLSRVVDYFNFQNTENYIVNLWSLSVEEQFYLIYPPLLLIFLRLGKKFPIIFLLLIFFPSLALAHFGSGILGKWNFYILPTRAWEISLGALCYFTSRDFVKIQSKTPLKF